MLESLLNFALKIHFDLFKRPLSRKIAHICLIAFPWCQCEGISALEKVISSFAESIMKGLLVFVATAYVFV